MPTPQASPILTSALLASAFLERLLRYLIPYFTDVTQDLAAARAEALETLLSYGARTRAELLAATQAIVFSLAALDALDEAKTLEMSPSLCLRFRGCANNLSRSGQKAEQTLAKRLACDPPIPTDLQADPTNDCSDPEAETILHQTQAEIATQRARTTPLSRQEQNNRLWGAAMINILAEMGMPVQPIPTPTPPA
jgi:hypothetical protein